MANHDIDRPGSLGSATDGSPVGRSGTDRPSDPASPIQRARETVDEIKQQAGSVASEAKEKGKSAIERQKDSAAGDLDAAADALRSGADRLQQDHPQAGRFVEYAAERLEKFGQQMRTKDLDTMLDDAMQMARRSPAAFFAGSVAAGFLLSRFVKSSAEARMRERSTGRSDASDYRTGSSEFRSGSDFDRSPTYPASGMGRQPSSDTGNSLQSGSVAASRPANASMSTTSTNTNPLGETDEPRSNR